MSTTLEQMEQLAARIAELRAKEAEASAAKKLISEELDKAEAKMLEALTQNDMRQYRSKVGLVSLGFFTSVKTPKLDSDKKAFFDYLKSLGLYDQMISVNSTTLNSFYRSKQEEAVAAGNDGFAIPGITEVTVEPRLLFRRS